MGDRNRSEMSCCGRGNHSIAPVDVEVFLYRDLFSPGQVVDFGRHPFLSLAYCDIGVQAPNPCHSCERPGRYHQQIQQNPLSLTELNRAGQEDF